jgi:prenyltransferase beta subunit
MPEDASFTTERHVKYYLRCLKTFLPSAYTSNDSNRMLLAYLTLSGLDVLGVLQSKTTTEERTGYINWLYHCQVATGGFRGFPGTDFGPERRNKNNEAWDPANVPATFFALVNLLVLGDDLSRVKRRECLEWLPNVQRDDGSFGELVGPDGSLGGARDLRYCCCAAGIRYILRGNGAGLEGVPDIDVSGLVSFIEACQVGGARALFWFADCIGVLTWSRLTMVVWPSLLFANRIVRVFVSFRLTFLMADRRTYILRDWSFGLLAQVLERLEITTVTIGGLGQV